VSSQHFKLTKIMTYQENIIIN